MMRTLRCAPISATKRPPGLSARATQAMTSGGASFIQCSAALEKTASAWPSMAKSRPSACSKASVGCSARARSTIAASPSIPITSAPRAAMAAVSVPVPQPRSTMRSPGSGASRSTMSVAKAETKPNERS